MEAVREIELQYKPHSKQKLIHTACDNPKFKYIVVVCGRGSGKSKAAQMQCCKAALRKPNQKIWVVSPSQSQAKIFFKAIAKPLIKSGVVTKHLEGNNDILLELINGSSISFKSGGSGDILRGTHGLDFLIIDEAAFIKKEVVEEVLLPMIGTKPNSKVLVTTTPKGKNWVFDWFVRGLDETQDNPYTSIKFTSYDNPKFDKSYIEQRRIEMNDQQFAQEYLAEFIDASSIFTRVEECCILPEQSKQAGDRYYVGVDIGMRADATVITVFNQKLEQVYLQRLKGSQETYQIKNAIKEVIRLYSPHKISIEQNNQGLPILSDLKYVDKIYNIEPFITTNQTKGEIVNELMFSMNTGLVKLLNNEILKSEMRAFVVSYTKTGTAQFFASFGHDDTILATAIAHRLAARNKFSGGGWVVR